MNILQDLYTKNILGTSIEVFKPKDLSSFGYVDSIEHKGNYSIVWIKNSSAPESKEGLGAFLNYLEAVVMDRKNNPTDKSYTASLLARGINKVAQKVGEEAVELVIEAKDNNKDLFLNECSDLFYHIVVLIVAKGYKLDEVIAVLKDRH